MTEDLDKRATMDACRAALVAGDMTCAEVPDRIKGLCENDWALQHSVIRLDLPQVLRAVRAGLRFIGAATT